MKACHIFDIFLPKTFNVQRFKKLLRNRSSYPRSQRKRKNEMGELVKIFKVLILVFAPLWLIFAPLGVALYVLLMPFGKMKRREASKAKVLVSIQGNPRGKEIVFVHGWPDSGNLWNLMLPYFKDYRCIDLQYYTKVK